MFFWKNICFLQNIHYLQKKCFYMKKKNFFYREKYKWKCNISEINFDAENVCVTNTIKILNIKHKYIFTLQKKIFFAHKKYVC